MFGGYLMRESFDMSWLTAHLFEDQSFPELLRVDQVLFLKPVEVGSVLKLKSKVTYSEYYEGLGNVIRVVTKGYNSLGE
jgi:acyl-coenzyme A thioesterase 9